MQGISRGYSCPASAFSLANMRCKVIMLRIWVKKSAVIVHSTSVDNEVEKPMSMARWIGGVPWRICISIGTESDRWAPAS